PEIGVELVKVARPQPLRLEVTAVVGVGTGEVLHPRAHLDAVRPQRLELGRVVRHDLDRLDAEIAEHERRHVVASEIVLETERAVGVDGVVALLLEGVRADLVAETDAAPLLPKVTDDAGVLLGDATEGEVELLPAVTLEAVEHLARHALTVDADEDVVRTLDVAVHDRDVLEGRVHFAVYDEAENPVLGGDVGFGIPSKPR